MTSQPPSNAKPARSTNLSLKSPATLSKLGSIVDGRRQIPFIGIGNSGHTDISERIDEILAEDWTKENLIDRNL